MRNAELVKIIDWIPKVWQHLNKFLEAHSSSDVTIGKCPGICKYMYFISLYIRCVCVHFLVLHQLKKFSLKPHF